MITERPENWLSIKRSSTRMPFKLSQDDEPHSITLLWEERSSREAELPLIFE